MRTLCFCHGVFLFCFVFLPLTASKKVQTSAAKETGSTWLFGQALVLSPITWKKCFCFCFFMCWGFWGVCDESVWGVALSIPLDVFSFGVSVTLNIYVLTILFTNEQGKSIIETKQNKSDLHAIERSGYRRKETIPRRLCIKKSF